MWLAISVFCVALSLKRGAKITIISVYKLHIVSGSEMNYE